MVPNVAYGAVVTSGFMYTDQIESLEQLRALAYGHRIFVAAADESSVEVDTPEDLAKAENYLRQLGN